MSALTKLIGTTQGGVHSAKGNCTIDAALYWANFSVYFLMCSDAGPKQLSPLSTDSARPRFELQG